MPSSGRDHLIRIIPGVVPGGRLTRANKGDGVIAERGIACLGGQIMACTLHVAWDDRLTGYDFGPGHPMAPARLELTIELARAFGLFAAAGVSVERPAPSTDAELGLAHIQPYIAAARQAGSPQPGASVLEFGLGTEDNPVFAGMHDASALVVGATLAAARAVWTGTAQHGASIAGGLHHAMPASASGFCVYNDPAIAISWLLAAGAERVAYVDIDVHHADGVQAAFYDSPRVLTISLHEHPATAFPGTGLAADTGSGAGAGYAVNVALPAGTGDGGWLPAFYAIVTPLVREFRPQVLISQHGCDSRTGSTRSRTSG
jgi:acetoin utilization protein AcuC